MRILAIIKSRNAAARPEFGAALLAKNNRVDISISLTTLYRIVYYVRADCRVNKKDLDASIWSIASRPFACAPPLPLAN